MAITQPTTYPGLILGAITYG